MDVVGVINTEALCQKRLLPFKEAGAVENDQTINRIY